MLCLLSLFHFSHFFPVTFGSFPYFCSLNFTFKFILSVSSGFLLVRKYEIIDCVLRRTTGLIS